MPPTRAGGTIKSAVCNAGHKVRVPAPPPDSMLDPVMSPSSPTGPAPKTVLVPAAQLTVLTEVDVLVIGAGTAGFVAAIGAARAGARTALIESNGFVGGANTATYNTG